VVYDNYFGTVFAGLEFEAELLLDGGEEGGGCVLVPGGGGAKAIGVVQDGEGQVGCPAESEIVVACQAGFVDNGTAESVEARELVGEDEHGEAVGFDSAGRCHHFVVLF